VHPIWVDMLVSSLDFFIVDIFKATRDKLGKFLGGLVEDIKLVVRNMSFVQRLDYVGIPFRCVHCHN